MPLPPNIMMPCPLSHDNNQVNLQRLLLPLQVYRQKKLLFVKDKDSSHQQLIQTSASFLNPGYHLLTVSLKPIFALTKKTLHNALKKLHLVAAQKARRPPNLGVKQPHYQTRSKSTLLLSACSVKEKKKTTEFACCVMCYLCYVSSPLQCCSVPLGFSLRDEPDIRTIIVQHEPAAEERAAFSLA